MENKLLFWLNIVIQFFTCAFWCGHNYPISLSRESSEDEFGGNAMYLLLKVFFFVNIVQHDSIHKQMLAVSDIAVLY